MWMVSHQVTTIELGLSYKFRQTIIWFLLRYIAPLPPLHPSEVNHLALLHPCQCFEDPTRQPSCFHSSSYFRAAFAKPSHPAQLFHLFRLFQFTVLSLLCLDHSNSPHFARRSCFYYLRYQKSRLFQFPSLIIKAVPWWLISQTDYFSWCHSQWTSFDCSWILSLGLDRWIHR